MWRPSNAIKVASYGDAIHRGHAGRLPGEDDEARGDDEAEEDEGHDADRQARLDRQRALLGRAALLTLDTVKVGERSKSR